MPFSKYGIAFGVNVRVQSLASGLMMHGAKLAVASCKISNRAYSTNIYSTTLNFTK